ncbi:Nucleotidyl transferase [Pyrolobus fumarii 1A]|uniref:Nucleotidyl transferase n=1 Tax=Pyrolobus fumarii (strain DSM 11204 / 1A) TaxID=694429 RepID=G0EHA7_PYRF1|nr:bifunctional sugar-1-phosphate nucleotidylyltransferase/acetyltransferase [Pyrolobus fumarii]AEM39331.1 Nucleotidyl transferase [Pyrolobus fumarii 1A]
MGGIALVDAALVLAGGRGERAWPLTATIYKPLLQLPGNESILSRLVRQVSRLAKRVYVLVPPGATEEFKKHLDSYGFTNVVVVEQQPYENGGYGSGAAVRQLLEVVPDIDSVLIVHGDTVIHDSVIDDLVKLAENREWGLVGFRTNRNGKRYGVIVADGSRVKRIVEKPGWSGEVVANAAIYLLPARLVREAVMNIGISERGEIEFPDAVNLVAKRLEDEGKWLRLLLIREEHRIDVGPWWEYLLASRMVLDWLVESGCRAEGNIAYNVIVKGVVCGEGFEVEGPSVLEGPIWLGRNARVGPFTHLRKYTILYDDVQVGAFVEIKGSVLMERTVARHHAYIGDSVVGPRSNIAAGTVFANLRHDNATVRSCAGGRVRNTGLRKLGAVLGEGVKTGVNSSIMPGARIGPCSWIEPGAVVRGDVPSCSFYRRDGEIVDIREAVANCCRGVRGGRGYGLCTKPE